MCGYFTVPLGPTYKTEQLHTSMSLKFKHNLPQAGASVEIFMCGIETTSGIRRPQLGNVDGGKGAAVQQAATAQSSPNQSRTHEKALLVDNPPDSVPGQSSASAQIGSSGDDTGAPPPYYAT